VRHAVKPARRIGGHLSGYKQRPLVPCFELTPNLSRDRPRGRHWLLAEDVSVLPPAGYGYGEELLDPS
jgi:hypothetical protein